MLRYRTVSLLAIMLPIVATTGLQAQESCVLSSEPPAFSPGPGTDRLHALPHGQTSGHNAFHGQALYGVEDLFLVHLAVFMGLPQSHPHNFQVVIEVEFDDAEKKRLYAQQRAQAPATLFTATPLNFDQTALVADYPGRQRLDRLPVRAIVRGHFEQGGVPILSDVTFDIERVVYFREFHLGGPKLDGQHYLVFGRDADLFGIHLLSAPPDFDQTLALEVVLDDSVPSEAASKVTDALATGLYLHLPGRSNEVGTRLRKGNEISCQLTPQPDASPITVTVRVRDELYCESGEFSQLVTEQFNQPKTCTD